MEYDQLATTALLQRWHGGDVEALNAILRRNESWIRDRVSRRLGRQLRAKLETGDVVQDALMRFLIDGPRLRTRDERQLRTLLALIVENVIRDKHDWFSSRRREMSREQQFAETTIVIVDARRPKPETPGTEAAHAEHQAAIRLALELMDPLDREVYLLRTWDALGFPEIARRLTLSPAAADKRFRRAAQRLQRLVERIRKGEIESLLREHEGADAAADDK